MSAAARDYWKETRWTARHLGLVLEVRDAAEPPDRYAFRAAGQAGDLYVTVSGTAPSAPLARQRAMVAAARLCRLLASRDG